MEIRRTLALRGDRTLSLVINDLLYEPVDAIVNAANGGLSHGGGVAAAISEAAGEELDDECRAYVQAHGFVPTGDSVVSTAGRLDFKGVIHAVGPRLGDGEEEAKLTTTVATALLRASQNGWRSVSFPAISSGIFAVPHEVCARAYVSGVREHFEDHPDSSLREVRICLYLSPLVDLVAQQMDAARGAVR